MTEEHLLAGGLVSAILLCAWLVWFLSRRPKPKRPGYVGDRWKR